MRPTLANRELVASLLQRLYPRMLHDAGIAGQTMMQFVVQPDGSVDPASVKVVATSHEQFGEASVKVVERIKFRPGQVNGVAVPVLLQMPLTWSPATVPAADAPEAANEIRVRGYEARNSRPAGEPAVRPAAYPLTIAVIGGSVKDASGQPLAGATVVIPALSRGTVTNQHGQFRLQAAAGTHDVQILVPGSQSPIVRSVTISPGELRETAVEVTVPIRRTQ